MKNESNDYQEYYLMKDSFIYKISIIKYNDEIIIKSRNYISNYNLNDLSVFNMQFTDINQAFEYLVNIFEENKIIIQKIFSNKYMKLFFELNNKKGIEINLLFTKENKYNDKNLIKEINSIKKELIFLKEENKNLNNEINKFNKYFNRNHPKNLEISSIIKKAPFAKNKIDNSFTVFKTINDLFYLVYSKTNKSLICYDLINQKNIIEIKTNHMEYITTLKHFQDLSNKKDLIMSLSKEEKNIKVWDVNNWQCLCNINKINKKSKLNSACFLNLKNENYIVTINENIKIFNIKGKLVDIIESQKSEYYIDSFYDKLLSRIFIFTGNYNAIVAYDFQKKQIYKKFSENEHEYHINFKMRYNAKNIEIIDSCSDGNIRIWNFHKGILIKKIRVSNDNLYGICLWHENYLFAICNDETIKLIDIKNNIIAKSLIHKACCINKIKLPKYGEILISQGWQFMENNIIIWSNKFINDI